MRTSSIAAAALAGAALFASQVMADETPAAAAPAAPAAAPAPPAFGIGMDGPITINPTPYVVDSGPLGKITINGAVSGLAFAQDNHVSGDHTGVGDLANAHILIEKTDGLVQFFVDAGSYSFPTVGVPYTKANHATTASFGNVPMAYIKIVPNSSFSITMGKLPTLIGAEYNFTFENMNIQRGLLWNQENLVNRGVQVNYATGPLSFALSVNDGFYSNSLSWVTGSASWTVDSSNTLVFAAGGNTRKTYTSNSATSPIYNNSQIYNLILTHTAGPWTIVPYLQYTSVPSLPGLGTSSGSTTGGAVFVNYSFPATAKMGDLSLSGFSIPTRLEYISSKGNAISGPNLLGYGNGSKAWSLTVTPTYQYKIYYIRGELSYVDVSSGSGFGTSGTAKSQTRGLLEAGVLF